MADTPDGRNYGDYDPAGITGILLDPDFHKWKVNQAKREIARLEERLETARRILYKLEEEVPGGDS